MSRMKAAVTLLALSLILAQAAAAANYNITKVSENTLGDDLYPAFNNRGQIAYYHTAVQFQTGDPSVTYEETGKYLFYQGGLNYMRYSVSNTAEYGAYVTGPRIITEATKAEMKRMLTEIQDGTYARNWILENQAGRPSFNSMRERERNTLVERVGRQLRGMMSWLHAK